jgi:hypothetical protein
MERIPIYVTSSGSRRMNPSPAAYHPHRPFGAEAKRISIHSKVEPREEVNDAPFADIPSSIGEGPQISIGELHVLPAHRGPEPDYVPPPFGSDTKGSRVGARTA